MSCSNRIGVHAWAPILSLNSTRSRSSPEKPEAFQSTPLVRGAGPPSSKPSKGRSKRMVRALDLFESNDVPPSDLLINTMFCQIMIPGAIKNTKVGHSGGSPGAFQSTPLVRGAFQSTLPPRRAPGVGFEVVIISKVILPRDSKPRVASRCRGSNETRDPQRRIFIICIWATKITAKSDRTTSSRTFVFRGTSLKRKCPTLGPYRRSMSRVLGRS